MFILANAAALSLLLGLGGCCLFEDRNKSLEDYLIAQATIDSYIANQRLAAQEAAAPACPPPAAQYSRRRAR